MEKHWDTYRPGSQEIDQEVTAEPRRKHLGDDVKIGDQCGLQDDGNIGGVEQLDGVSVVLAAVARRLDGKVHSEALGRRKNRNKSLSKYLTKNTEADWLFRNIFAT